MVLCCNRWNTETRRRKLLSRFKVEADVIGPAGTVAVHASDIASGSRIVAALCHYSLCHPDADSPNIRGLSALRSRMCVENARDPAPSDSCPAHARCVLNRASQPNEIEFGHINSCKKVFDLFGLPL
jgi:hypothetical protein